MRYYLSFFFLIQYFQLTAQSLQVSTNSLENDLSILQLKGDLIDGGSLTIRPYVFTKFSPVDSFYSKLSNSNQKAIKERKQYFLGDKGKISLLPLKLITRFNSDAPFGWSDGLLMPAKGIQQFANVGIFAELGPIKFQFSPEYLYASNDEYHITEKFGESNPIKNITKISLGQSYLSLYISSFSLGVSNENIWWGPGYNTSLLITNNAPGFLHASFKTIRPLKTLIGNFEWQVISGRLNANDTKPEDVYNRKTHLEVWGSLTDNYDYSKYINGINFVYEPKFLKGLFLGLNRVFVSKNLNKIQDVNARVGFRGAYLPIFDGLFKQSRNTFEDSLQWNQLASVYAKYLFKKANAEIYLEYGWNDHAFNLRDFLVSPNHSAAFLIGFKKLIKLKQKNSIDFSIEYNQFSQSVNYLVRNAGSWYYHGYFAHLSNNGETLGSGVGYGSDVLTFSSLFRKGLDNYGIKFQKINREPNVYQTNWSDFAITGMFRKKVKSTLLNFDLTGVRSQNYGWESNKRLFNFIGQFGFSYFW